MWMTALTHRFVRLAIALGVTVAATTAVSAQEQGITYEVVAHFDNPTRNGNTPAALLVPASDGTFYGTTSAGGRFGRGTVFSITVAGTFTLLHDFAGDDGATPISPLVQGSDGNLYGTTLRGGAANLGVVFKIEPSGTFTTLHSFDGADGQYPQAGVIQATDGRFYGTTAGLAEPQGSGPGGTLFRIDAAGSFEALYRFDGLHPDVELLQARDGNLYGGARGQGFLVAATIFKSDLSGAVTFLRTFASGQSLPGPLREAREGYIYGLLSTDAAAPAIQWTCHGGPNQQWRLEPAGGGAFRIIARHSGQALDVFSASVDDLAPIIQWPVHGGDNQVWTLEPASDGYLRLVVRHSGKAMDVELASTDDGARVIQYTPHDGAHQQWLLHPVE